MSFRSAAAALGLGEFGRRVGIVAGGTAAGQAVILLASPVLTRLYSASDLGTLGVYVSLLSMVAVVVSLRYELAIPMAEDQEYVSALLVLAIGVAGVVSLLVAIAVLVAGEPLALLMNTPALAPYLFLLPLGLLGFGIYQAFNYQAIRDKAFASIATTKLNQSLGQSGTQVGLGLLWAGPPGLIVGHFLGQVLGTGTLVRAARKRRGFAIGPVHVETVRKVAARYRRFPLLSSFSGFLNTAGLQAPVLIVAATYGPEPAGWYALANRVVGAPLGLIGNAVAQVYLSEAPALAREAPERLRVLFRGTALRLMFIGGAAVAVVMIGGGPLFGLVFGDGWQDAGVFAQLLGPMFLAQFVAGPLSQTLNVLERQDLQLAWDAGRLLLVIGAFWLGAASDWPPAWTISAFSIAMLVSYLALLVLARCALTARAEKPGQGQSA